MISNQFNVIEGIDPEVDALRKLGNRVKTLRMRGGHYHYEKYAYQHNIGRILLKRVETGAKVNYKNLLKIIQALDVTPAEFFSEGLD
jgi:predicted transcriptional regulator